MAKAPALSTQLKTASARIVELEKQLTAAKSSAEYQSKNANEATAMLEQVHQVLDAVPQPIPRESEGENSWDRVKRSPVTRLAAWLAIRPH
jgi:predicted  nucleic acid-binding Zn-ribbon protein